MRPKEDVGVHTLQQHIRNQRLPEEQTPALAEGCSQTRRHNGESS